MKPDLLIELETWTRDNLLIELDSRQKTCFATYLTLLREWNQKFNLTAITEDREILHRHFIDSLTCLLVQKTNPGNQLLDIGTGGGFPGIPLAILSPELRVTLMESIGKKILFLEKVKVELGLKNITILQQRAEESGHDPRYRETFDIVVSRALAKLPTAVELCLPFVRMNGFYLAMLGDDAEDQLKNSQVAMSELGGELLSMKNVSQDLNLPPGQLSYYKKFKRLNLNIPGGPGFRLNDLY